VLVPGGCGIELPAFAALTSVRQQSRASSRSALRAHPPALRSSAPPNGATAGKRRNGLKFGLFGIRLLAVRLFAPFGGAEQHSQARRGRQPASSTDSARLFDRSERSERREFRAGRGWRAAEAGHKAPCGRLVPAEGQRLLALAQGILAAGQDAGAGAGAFPPFWQDKRGSGAGVKPLRAATKTEPPAGLRYLSPNGALTPDTPPPPSPSSTKTSACPKPPSDNAPHTSHSADTRPRP